MSKIEQQVELNGFELNDYLRHIISTNQENQKLGITPLAVEVIGESGIGKTSNIIQLAEDMQLNFVKLNLAQIEELGDLVGFPVRQFLMCRKGEGQPAVTKMVEKKVKKQVKIKKMVDGKLVDEIVEREVPVKEEVVIPATGGLEEVWVDEVAIEDYRKLGYVASDKADNKRMSYCPPEWISGKSNGGILLLDDWNRADTRFIQAVMELVDRQEYISWKLPENWHIILTANPDNGDYLVNATDVAQRTRYASVVYKFEAEVWAKWAEHSNVDGRCINFLLMTPEVITQDVNPRAITNFFNIIRTVEDFDQSLGTIQSMGESTVGSDAAMLFTQFIANKLDKLITPEQILTGLTDKGVIAELKKLVWEGDNYRADLASMFTNRIINYAAKFAEKNTITQDIINRLTALIKDEDLFNYDLKYVLAKRLVSENKLKFQKLVLDKEVSQLVTA